MTRSRRLTLALSLAATLCGACTSSPLSPEPGSNGNTGNAGNAGSTGGTAAPPSAPVDATPWVPQLAPGVAF